MIWRKEGKVPKEGSNLAKHYMCLEESFRGLPDPTTYEGLKTSFMEWLCNFRPHSGPTSSTTSWIPYQRY